jgi:2-keto-3-deoxy-L-rhamnonate aldolase RhmA
MRDNDVKARLARGETAIGTMVFEFFVPGLPRLLAHTGADFVIYDMEHGGVSIEMLRVLAAASRGPSPVPFVRVPDTEYHFMAQALDAGMLGLMLPNVQDGAQAQTIADATRYPPLGRRGAGLGMAQDDYERGSTVDKIEALNARTFVMAQIESPAGLEHVEFDSPRFLDAIKRVADCADRHGLVAGVMVGDPAGAEHWMALGYRALAYGADFRLYADALKSGIEAVRRL